MKRFSVFQIVLILLGAALLCNGVHVLMVTNFNLGSLLVLGLGAAILLYGVLLRRLRRQRWLHILAAVCSLVLAVCIGAVAFAGANDNPTYDEDAVLVLGCGIHGETVTTSLANRLNAAAAYHAQNPDALIVVSGGQGPQESVTEAAAMERYLLSRGVPAEKILKEEQATSTLENFKNTVPLLKERFPDGYTLTVITSRFHVFRAVKIAQQAGLSVTHVGAGIRWYTIPMNYLRELVAIANEVRRGSIRL